MFSNNEAVIAWAALAEECDLSNLLATAEVHMVKTLDPNFWQSKSFAAHKLSQACFLRLLQGAQYHAVKSACIHKAQQQTSNPVKWFADKCPNYIHEGWCIHCHLHTHTPFQLGTMQAFRRCRSGITSEVVSFYTCSGTIQSTIIVSQAHRPAFTCTWLFVPLAERSGSLSCSKHHSNNVSRA